MENKLSSILFVIIIAVIAITTYWLKLNVDKELYKNKSPLANGPEFYLEQFTTQQTSENGEIKFILAGKEMTHFDHLNKTFLKNPNFTKFENNNPYSSISGDAGEIRNKGDEIIVDKNVKLIRMETKTKKEMKLYTDSIIILPKTNIVFTKSAVKIIQEPNIEINGVGMTYDKNENTFKLLKNVKVHYEKVKR